MFKNNSNFIKTFTVVILLACLLLIVGGVTYALYRNFLAGETVNMITTGNISFAYTEGDFFGNGIKIDDAFPLSDAEGKKLYGENKYFDFNVNGSSTISDVNYEIVVNKEDISTMDDSIIKIYLTELDITSEIPSVYTYDESGVRRYSELQDSVKQVGKIVYLGTMKKNDLNFSKKYRLRMWIAKNTDSELFMNKTYSVKVNVVAY